MVSSECHETLITAATRSCANCHLYRLVCSKYLGALTVCWKICSIFDKQTVDCILHKPQHKSHGLHMLAFDSAGKFCLLSGYVQVATAGSMDWFSFP